MKSPALLLALGAAIFAAGSARADDWPQFRGSNRDAAWNEAGILQAFPPEGLKVARRSPVGEGLSSPVVAQGRIYLIGSALEKPKAREPVHSLDEKTGRPLWSHAYDVAYPAQNSGPNATPVVHGGKIYTLGQMGDLLCLDAATGEEIWITDKVTSKGQGAAIYITPNGDTFLLFTDLWNLIRAKLSPAGYDELSRVHLVDPAHFFAVRKLVWPPPAYADGHIFIHNGGELVCMSLEAAPAR